MGRNHSNSPPPAGRYVDDSDDAEGEYFLIESEGRFRTKELKRDSNPDFIVDDGGYSSLKSK